MRTVSVFGPDGIFLTSYPVPEAEPLSEREIFRRAAVQVVDEGWVTSWEASSLRFELTEE